MDFDYFEIKTDYNHFEINYSITIDGQCIYILTNTNKIIAWGNVRGLLYNEHNVHNQGFLDKPKIYTFNECQDFKCNINFNQECFKFIKDRDLEKLEKTKKSFNLRCISLKRGYNPNPNHIDPIESMCLKFYSDLKTITISNKTNRYVPINFFITEKISKIATGSNHGLFLTNKSKLYGIGNNSNGQITSDENLNFSDIPILINSETKHFLDEKEIKNIYAVDCSSFCILEKGDLFSWGSNNNGILGFKSKNEREKPTKVMNIPVKYLFPGYSNVFCITINNQLYGWGDNRVNQTSPFSVQSLLTPCLLNLNGLIPKFIVNSRTFTLCVANHSSNNKQYLLSWGDNTRGCLGIGNKHRTNGVKLVNLPDDSIIKMTVNGSETWEKFYHRHSSIKTKQIIQTLLILSLKEKESELPKFTESLFFLLPREIMCEIFAFLLYEQ